MNESNQWLLLFDNECTTCIKFSHFAQRFASSELQVQSLQDYTQSSNDLLYSDLMKDIHLVSPQKEVFIGNEAMEKLILLFPALKPFQWLLTTQLGKKSSHVIYSSISRFRRCRKCT